MAEMEVLVVLTVEEGMEAQAGRVVPGALGMSTAVQFPLTIFLTLALPGWWTPQSPNTYRTAMVTRLRKLALKQIGTASQLGSAEAPGQEDFSPSIRFMKELLAKTGS